MKQLFLLAFAGVMSLESNGQIPKDEDQVKKVVIAFQEGFNEGSFKNAQDYTTTDWEHINPFGGITKGRDTTLADVRRVHQTFLKGVTMKVVSMDIRFPAPNVAIAVVIHQMDNYTTPDGLQHNGEKHTKSYVIVKQKDKWLLTLDHNTIKTY